MEASEGDDNIPGSAKVKWPFDYLRPPHGLDPATLLANAKPGSGRANLSLGLPGWYAEINPLWQGILRLLTPPILRSVPFRSVPFRSVPLRSVPFRSVPFSSVPLLLFLAVSIPLHLFASRDLVHAFVCFLFRLRFCLFFCSFQLGSFYYVCFSFLQVLPFLSVSI
jgi:hypothetical protein